MNAGADENTWDVVIVGAGSAGCVLAHRLSAESSRRVLLLEAGPDIPPDRVPEDVQDLFPRSYYNPAYMWPALKAYLRSREEGSPRPFDQARVMGGGSTVMGMLANRGQPSDYDRWVTLGATGWSWSDVLPYFVRLENDLDYDGAHHGKSGPVPIRRHPVEDWPPFCQAIGEAVSRRGYPVVADMNADFRDGYCSLPLSSTPSARVSSASAYLDAGTRRRPNLSIQTDTTVRRVIFEGLRAAGVVASRGGTTTTHRARRLILSAGGIHTPTLLLRSGVGPPDELKALGIDVVHASRGVGRNLQNHAVIYLATHLKPGARQSRAQRSVFNSALRFSSGVDTGLTGDMLMLVLNKSSWHGLGERIGALGVSVYSPFSRGAVTLDSPNPEQPPRVEFRYLSDARDLQRMIDGLRLALDLMRDPAVAPVRNELFAAGYSENVRRLNTPSPLNAALTTVLGAALDGPAWLRRQLMRRGVAPHEVDEADMDNDSWLRQTVQERTISMFHPAGTCRMGAVVDPDAVLDPNCSVQGISGLHVVDASIMPTLVRGNTNIPTIMLAEKASDLLLREAV